MGGAGGGGGLASAGGLGRLRVGGSGRMEGTASTSQRWRMMWGVRGGVATKWRGLDVRAWLTVSEKGDEVSE